MKYPTPEDERRQHVRENTWEETLKFWRPRRVYPELAGRYPLEWYEEEIRRRVTSGEAPTPLPDDVAMLLLMEVSPNDT